MFEFINPTILQWVIIPLLICIARIIDVSIGTIRIIYVSKGFKYLAPVLGFFEIIVWLVAITQVMKNLTHWINYVAYALGFALGNFVGILLEKKISMGNVIVRIITRKDPSQLIDYLKTEKYKVTIIEGKNAFDREAHLLFTIVKRKKIKEVVSQIKEFNPKAFYSIEDVKYVSDANNSGYSFKNKLFDFRKLFQRKGK
ncbi:MAG: DUF2179 domain-containing protein [Nanoarchaeota archaeon]|nr:DUF2179 domain-containing protein [Nanoarchaeota archaeon]